MQEVIEILLNIPRPYSKESSVYFTATQQEVILKNDYSRSSG